MTTPLHAHYYADHALQRTVTIVENSPLARDTWRVRFAFGELAERIVPGQFLMLRLTGRPDPLIGRPFAMYNVLPGADGRPELVDVVYLVKGKFTTALAGLGVGERLDVWGPLGNGFARTPVEHLILAAGGIGQTPFLSVGLAALGRRAFGLDQTRPNATARRVTLCYGARRAEYLAGIEQFEAAGMEVRIATDDGSRGRRGFVTELVREALDETPNATRRVLACGPEPMMEAVARIARDADVPCDVSLETPMACGIGICFTCVAKVRDEQGAWDYQRTCVEGPVFDATRIEW